MAWFGDIVGLARNVHHNDQAAPWMETAAQDFAGGRHHAAAVRRARLRRRDLDGVAQELCEKLCCQRGGMENRINEQRRDLFADRTSGHHWWPNQFRRLRSVTACALIETTRRPLRLDEDFVVGVSVIRVGRSSLTYDLNIRVGDEDEPRATGEIVSVHADQSTNRSTPLPGGLLDLLAKRGFVRAG